MPMSTSLSIETLIEPLPIKNNHRYISHPNLYPTPIPYRNTSGIASDIPSPYVVNHKRRDLLQQQQIKEVVDGGVVKEEVVEESRDEFYDGRDTMSVVSSGGSDSEEFWRGGSVLGRRTVVSSDRSDFFDVDEEFSDSSIPNTWSPCSGSTSGLHAAKVNLFDEIERRKRAEDAIAKLQSQWQRIREHTSQIGLSSFPEMLDVEKDGDQVMDSAEQFCQEVVFSRYVSEAIEKSLARAEAEEVAETVIEMKNLEISRLRDKLQYYESVNHEMSMRNQEVLVVARKQRQWRKTKQKWFWTGVGFAVTMGASLLAYSYLPSTSRHEPASSGDLLEALPESTKSA